MTTREDEHSEKTVERPLMGAGIYDHLLSQIVSQQILPGARLQVDRLVRELGVSQTPIRQALIRLQAEGLVNNKRNSGFTVAPIPDKARMLESLQFRRIVEPHAAKLAAARISEPQQAELRAVLETLERSKSGDADTYGNFSATDVVFHDLIATCSANEVIAATLADVRRRTVSFRRSFPEDMRESLQAEHVAIAEAICEGQEEDAFEAMQSHIDSAIYWLELAR